MNTPQLLITGDYWHSDFRECFSTLDAPATMIPIDNIESIAGQEFFVIVLSQSRRDQFAQAEVDNIRQLLPDTPIVVLLGTWCEGENRSGRPLAGVTQVPWNQWKNQFERYCIQIFEGVTPDWHQPLTATVADRIRDYTPDAGLVELLRGKKILISAEDTATYESLADMLNIYQCMSYWAEQAPTDLESEGINATLIDGNSLSEDFTRRIKVLTEMAGELPTVALLNFPRKQDFASLATMGIEEVISKPFTHNELLYSLSRAMGLKVVSG